MSTTFLTIHFQAREVREDRQDILDRGKGLVVRFSENKDVISIYIMWDIDFSPIHLISIYHPFLHSFLDESTEGIHYQIKRIGEIGFLALVPFDF